MDIARLFTYTYFKSFFPDDAKWDDRFFQSSALEVMPQERPFIIYRIGNNQPDVVGDDGVATFLQPVQVFVHDDPGDFASRVDPWIDTIVLSMGQPFVEAVLEACPMVSRVTLDYVSQDTRDPEWGTIVRYLRFFIHYRNPLV